MERLGSKTRARVIKWFQITARDKILWLSEKEYRKRLNRPGYLLGWIDERHIFFGGGFLLSQDLLADLLAQGWTNFIEPMNYFKDTMAPRGHDL